MGYGTDAARTRLHTRVTFIIFVKIFGQECIDRIATGTNIGTSIDTNIVNSCGS